MRHCANHPSRRDVIRGLGLGLLLGGKILKPTGLLAADGSPFTKKDGIYKKPAPPAKVGLVKGGDLRNITFQALKRIEDNVLGSVGNKRILIKPNFVSTDRQLAATHVDSIRGILDFLKPRCKNEIVVGESTASRDGTFAGYENFGYLALEKEYGIKLIDLNKQSWQYRYVFGAGHRPTAIRIISDFLDPDTFIISAAKMKTHDRVVTTLSLKNVLLGSPLNDYKKNDKWLTHMASTFSRESLLNYNMFHLAQEIYPDLGVIDGFTAMEGNGPVGGDPVEAKVALASTDALALDTVTTKIMGFDPSKIMYLASMAEAGMGQGDLDKMTVLGTPLEECQYKFKLHKKLQEAYGA